MLQMNFLKLPIFSHKFSSETSILFISPTMNCQWLSNQWKDQVWYSLPYIPLMSFVWKWYIFVLSNKYLPNSWHVQPRMGCIKTLWVTYNEHNFKKKIEFKYLCDFQVQGYMHFSCIMKRIKEFPKPKLVSYQFNKIAERTCLSCMNSGPVWVMCPSLNKSLWLS